MESLLLSNLSFLILLRNTTSFACFVVCMRETEQR